MTPELNKIYQGDCLDFMRGLPDKTFDLVLTDPPYGIGADSAAHEAAMSRIRANGKSKAGRGWKFYEDHGWDKSRPTPECFDEMMRVSKNQIIWGGTILRTFCRHQWGGLPGTRASASFPWQTANSRGLLLTRRCGFLLTRGLPQ